MRVINRAILLMTAALTVASVHIGHTQANTFFVAQNGDDSSTGTISQPWRTIRDAVSRLRPGDTLYIRGGTSTGTANVVDSQSSYVPSGTSWSNPITIAGYPGETVKLQPPTGTSGIRLTTSAPSYLVFQDFIIDKVNETTYAEGIYVGNGAHHNRFLRLEVKNNFNNGVSFSDANGNSPFNEVINCRIHDNGRQEGINRGYGAYITSSDNLFDGNDIYNNGGYGLHFYNNGGPLDVARNVIRNNRIYGNGTHGGSNYGLVVAWGADNLVYNNIIFGNRGGILVYNNSERASIYNNTIYNNSGEGIAMQYYASAPIVKNNIVYGNAAGIVDNGGSGTPQMSNNLTSNPRFTNASAMDFTLLSDSPARDAGVEVPSVPTDFNGIRRPQEGAFDIGAHEYSAGAPPAPRPPQNVRLLTR